MVFLGYLYDGMGYFFGKLFAVGVKGKSLKVLGIC